MKLIYSQLNFKNTLYGLIYSEKELHYIIENNRINKNNENMKKMFETIVNGYPAHFINSNNKLPLCIYGRKNKIIGIEQFSYLKSINK